MRIQHIYVGGEKPKDRPSWAINYDCCPFCGMSGLEMVHYGYSECTPERRSTFAMAQWPRMWLEQTRFGEWR